MLTFYSEKHAAYSIPQTATRFKSEAANVTGYLFTNKGAPAAAVFIGRKKKAALYCRYQDEAKRTKAIANIIASQTKAEEDKKAYRDKQNQPTTLKVGDILSSSWGFDQTIVDFYRVVQILGKRKVSLIEIGATTTMNGYCSMSGTVTPNNDDERGAAFSRMVTHGVDVAIHHSSTAQPWNGKPLHRSWYG